ncbi:UbiA family prenyltransferase [bacterium]|nr:UbiA family prenyltransferase [bacterium]
MEHSQDIALAVDLDGTLLRSDTLYDSFFDVLSRDLVGALSAVTALKDGKAALKAALADRAEIEPENLPYEPAVLALIEEARAAGRKTVLVSASDQRLVQAIADHLGVFDEAHGSDGARNLSGAAKADWLAERFGEKGFDYVGDGIVDLPVWARARRALTAGAPGRVRAAVDKAHPDAVHIAPQDAGAAAKALLRAMRPHQWVKNLLVFLPALAGHRLNEDTIGPAIGAFVAFCLVASSVYLLNDLLDLKSDRAHSKKHARPLASGAARLAHGVVMAPALLAGGFGVALAMGQGDFVLVLLVYWLITLAYSLYLKRQLVIDILTLAALYTIRVIGGGAATGLVLSPWLFALAIFLFLSLAAIKRQAELVNSIKQGKTDLNGRAYRADDLPIIAMFATSAGYMAVMVMALFVSGERVRKIHQSTIAVYNSPLILWLICPVLLYWISRVVMLTHRGRMNEDPVMFALRDPISLLCGFLMVAIVMAAKYL